MNTETTSAINALSKINIDTVLAGRENKVEEGFDAALRQAITEQDDQKLREACRDMESLFVYKLLQQMRATVPEGGYLPVSSAEKIYRDMLDQEYSKVIAASNRNFGLATMLYEQLQSKSSNDKQE